MSSFNTIVLRGNGEEEEMKSAGVFKPGHLLVRNSSGEVSVHSTAGGRSSRLIAKEDALQGKGVLDAYADDDQVPVYAIVPQDLLQMRIQAAATAFLEGAQLMSAGDGSLIPIPTVGPLDLYANVADSAAVTNTTVATAFDKSYTIPANFLQVGDVIRIRGTALATATHTTDTLTLTLKIGSTTIKATAAVDVADNDIGTFDVVLTIRTIGASGTFVGQGTQALGTPGTVTDKPFTLLSTALDTTATQVLAIFATWSAADSGNSVILKEFVIELDRITNYYPLFEAEEAIDNSAGIVEVFAEVRAL